MDAITFRMMGLPRQVTLQKSEEDVQPTIVNISSINHFCSHIGISHETEKTSGRVPGSGVVAAGVKVKFTFESSTGGATPGKYWAKSPILISAADAVRVPLAAGQFSKRGSWHAYAM